MSEDPEKLKKSVKEHSDKLAKLGMELGEIQFNYKNEEKASKEYWQQRIDDFKKYNEKGLEYYNQVHAMMNLVNEEESEMFLLRISKFRQLSTTLIEIMEKIKENPSIIDPKDKQQSKWSKEIKNQITEQSKKCLRYEMDTNTSFREFYEKYLKKIIG
jgi:argininosuccinate lyase